MKKKKRFTKKELIEYTRKLIQEKKFKLRDVDHGVYKIS